MANEKVLSQGKGQSGDLKFEIWTDRGRSGLVYEQGDTLSLFLRVNQEAWIRLVYMLADGTHVALASDYHIDSDMVNAEVEYPDSFDVAEPYGVEQLHATAFTQKPPRVAIDHRMIGGTRYSVIREGIDAVVTTRGLVAQKPEQEMAEDYVTVTTTPRTRGQ